MKTVDAHDNADDTRHSPEVVTATISTLDDAILSVLDDFGGGPIAWTLVRAQLPTSRFWKSIEALVRLHLSGQIHAVKVDGSTFLTAA